MSDMLVFGFHYKQRFYQAIANIWKKSTNGLYRITVMNGDLERLLFGNNIYCSRDEKFFLNDAEHNLELVQLHQVLVSALNNHRLGMNNAL